MPQECGHQGLAGLQRRGVVGSPEIDPEQTDEGAPEAVAKHLHDVGAARGERPGLQGLWKAGGYCT